MKTKELDQLNSRVVTIKETSDYYTKKAKALTELERIEIVKLTACHKMLGRIIIGSKNVDEIVNRLGSEMTNTTDRIKELNKKM